MLILMLILITPSTHERKYHCARGGGGGGGALLILITILMDLRVRTLWPCVSFTIQVTATDDAMDPERDPRRCGHAASMCQVSSWHRRNGRVPETPGAALHHVSCLIQHARSVSRTHVTVNVTLACIRRTESKKKTSERE